MLGVQRRLIAWVAALSDKDLHGLKASFLGFFTFGLRSCFVTSGRVKNKNWNEVLKM